MHSATAWRAAVLAASFAFASTAHARSAGLAALGCDGCHSGGKPTTVTLSADPMTAGVGEPITLTISVAQTNGATAGFYVTTAFDAPGTFRAVEAGTAVDSSGVIHTTPRSGSGGATSFKVQWTATRPTGVDFDVFALSANGDRSNRGDGAGAATLALAVGCAAQPFYIDQDGDGYGSDDPAFRPRQDCVAPPGYAARAGDCNDFRAAVFPTAPELCDQLDNDCNGEVDDDVVSQSFCADEDGDGHGVVGRETKVDCKPSAGFGACDGDCDDRDARFHPGAEELCDLRDNDCDGEVDEGVRAVCGVGLCARRARGCDATDCTPGDPLPEICNAYDDDCDGVIDNGDALALCGDPLARCVDGRCVGTTGSSGSSGASGGAPSGAAGAGPSGGSAPMKASEPSCGVSAHDSGPHGLLGSALALAWWLIRGGRASRLSKRGKPDRAPRRSYPLPPPR